MPRSESLKPRTMLPLTTALWLSACATAPVFRPQPTDACRLLPMQQYTDAFNQELADEVAAAPSNAVWPQVVRDYVKLRDAVKACER